MIRALFGLLLLCLAGCAGERPYVVLYTSQDQFYAEPILADFTKETGIEIRPVFDTESAKTAALAHRLRAENGNPQCDVFWSNEEMHARLLLRDGALSSNLWRNVGFRTRRVVINTNLLSASDAPRSLLELTQRRWNDKVALAYPLFGTTSHHFLALRQHWGDQVWREWCAGLVRNGAKVVDGNSLVVRFVGAGECWIGLTDSDDIAAGQRQGLPIMALPYIEEPLVIPNTIATVIHPPHPDAAEKLIAYLAQPSTLQKLVNLGALEGIQPRDARYSGGTSSTSLKLSRGTNSRSLKVDWSSPLADLDAMNEILKQIFLRT